VNGRLRRAGRRSARDERNMLLQVEPLITRAPPAIAPRAASQSRECRRPGAGLPGSARRQSAGTSGATADVPRLGSSPFCITLRSAKFRQSASRAAGMSPIDETNEDNFGEARPRRNRKVMYQDVLNKLAKTVPKTRGRCCCLLPSRTFPMRNAAKGAQHSVGNRDVTAFRGPRKACSRRSKVLRTIRRRTSCQYGA